MADDAETMRVQLRWISNLEKHGLLVRVQDPLDGRRAHVRLSPEAHLKLKAYLRRVAEGRCQPSKRRGYDAGRPPDYRCKPVLRCRWRHDPWRRNVMLPHSP